MTIDDGSLGTLADALAPLVEHVKEQKAEIERLVAACIAGLLLLMVVTG